MGKRPLTCYSAFKMRYVSLASAIAFLLSLVGAAHANDADDKLYRLITQARQQFAAPGSRTYLEKTLLEVSKLVPNLSMDGLVAVIAFSDEIKGLRYDQQDQTVRPALPPDPGSSAPQFSQKPSAPEFSVTSDRPPPLSLEPLTPPTPLAADPPTSALSLNVLPVAPAVVPPARIASSQPSITLLDMLRRRGDNALRTGDISAARLFYKRGVEAGCGACAEALAQTYDADQLRRMGVMGIMADPAQAEAWRARARQLGQTGTSQ